MTSPLASFVGADVVGLLGRDVTVELLNISRSGCLIESPSVIPAGAFGTLSVEIDGRTYVEDVRIARCLTVPGAGERHRIGIEFLSLRRPGSGSLRLYAASLQGGAARADASPPVEGEAAGGGSPAALRFRPSN